MLYRLKLLSTGHRFPDIATIVECDSSDQAAIAAFRWLLQENRKSGLPAGPYDRWDLAQVLLTGDPGPVAAGDNSTPQAG